MKSAEIKQQLIEGCSFGNEVSNWYSLCNVSQNRFILVINEKTKIYKNIDSVSKRISQLIKKGS